MLVGFVFAHGVTRIKGPGLPRFSIDATPTASLKTGAIYLKTLAMPRPRRVFRPTDRGFDLRPFAGAPIRLNLERHGGVLRLVERVAVPAVFELVEDSASQFGGLYS